MNLEERHPDKCVGVCVSLNLARFVGLLAPQNQTIKSLPNWRALYTILGLEQQSRTLNLLD